MSRRNQPFSTTSNETLRGSQVYNPQSRSTYQPDSAEHGGPSREIVANQPEEDGVSVERIAAERTAAQRAAAQHRTSEHAVGNEFASLELLELAQSLHDPSIYADHSHIAEDSLIGRDDNQISVPRFLPLTENPLSRSGSAALSPPEQPTVTTASTIHRSTSCPAETVQYRPVPAPRRSRSYPKTEESNTRTLTPVPEGPSGGNTVHITVNTASNNLPPQQVPAPPPPNYYPHPPGAYQGQYPVGPGHPVPHQHVHGFQAPGYSCSQCWPPHPPQGQLMVNPHMHPMQNPPVHHVHYIPQQPGQGHMDGYAPHVSNQPSVQSSDGGSHNIASGRPHPLNHQGPSNQLPPNQPSNQQLPDPQPSNQQPPNPQQSNHQRPIPQSSNQQSLNPQPSNLSANSIQTPPVPADRAAASSAVVDRQMEVLSLSQKKELTRTALNQSAYSLPAKLTQKSMLEEEEAKKQFRLKFRLAELKEKGGKLEEALEEYNWALYYEMEANGENNLEVAKTNRIIARVCLKAKKYRQAEQHLLQAISIFNRCGAPDSDNLWNMHDQLAQTYMHIGDREKEVKHYKIAIDILTDSTDVPPERLAHMHNNVGVSLHKMGKLDEACGHINKSKEMMSQMHMGADSEDMAKVHRSLGDLYKDQGHLDKAAAELESCLRIRAKALSGVKGKILNSPIHKSLAEIYELLGDLVIAREHARLGEEGVDQMGSIENRELLSRMAEDAGVLTLPRDAQEAVDIAQKAQQDNNNHLAIQQYLKAIESVHTMPPDQLSLDSVQSKLAMMHNNLSNAYRSVGRLAEAMAEMEQALHTRRVLYGNTPHEDTASSLFNIGFIYAQYEDVAKQVESFNYHKEALEMYLQLGNIKANLKWIVGLYRSLAAISYKLGESQQSVTYYEDARRVIKQHCTDGNTEMAKQLQAISNNIGNSYKSLKKFKQAEENLQQALELATHLGVANPDNMEYQNDRASAYNNLGCLYQQMENYPMALQHHQEGLKIRRQVAPRYAEAATDLPSSLHNIANTYLAASELNEALRYYEEEYEVRCNLGDDTSDVLISMSKIYETKGDMDKAAECVNRARH